MSVDLKPGAIFAGDFRVVRPLSEGGMGSVYVVEQLSTGAQRALKLMKRELVVDASLRERFLQEARVGSRIASDHVVQVIAAGVDPETNVPWLVMELLAGEEMADRVRRSGPLSRAEVAEVAKQLTHALAAAHAVGVVHRDLKPNNLFLAASRTAGAPFSVKVLDFGIAKIVADAKTTGTVGLGTPLWMAPEQTEAKSYVGPGTDVWAFGLIVFYMLTGRSFWAAAAQANTGIQTLLREILFEPIAPPSQRAAELGAPALPPGFDAWFLRCIERDPQRRETSVERALAGLLPLLAAPALEPPRRAGPTQIAEPLPYGQSGPSPLPAYTTPAGPNPIAMPTGSGAAPQGYATPPPPAQPGQAYAPQHATGAGWPPTHVPVVGAPTPVTPRRSSLGGILAIAAAAVVVLGGGGAWLAFGGDKKKPKTSDRAEKKRRSSDDDDDDDDDDGSDQPADPKTADCAELQRLARAVETDLEAIMSDDEMSELAKLDAKAVALEKHSAEAKRVELATADGRGLLARWTALLDDYASTTRKGAAAVRNQDQISAQAADAKFEKLATRLQTLVEDGERMCPTVSEPAL